MGSDPALPVKARLSQDMKTAMVGKDKESLSVIRMLLSEIKYAQAKVNLQAELPEAENLKVIASYHKKLAKSLSDFPEGPEKENVKKEMVIVEKYLPQKASEAEVEAVVKSIWAQGGDRGNLGATIKAATEKLEGRADGRMLTEVIKRLQS